MNGKDWTTDAIVLAKVKRVSARPDVAAWLDTPDRNHRERALLALAVAHTIAWQPKKKRPADMRWLDVYEVQGGAGGRDGRSVQLIGGEDGGLLFAPRHLARVELAHELCCLLYSAHRVRPLSRGCFWWYLIKARKNRP